MYYPQIKSLSIVTNQGKVWHITKLDRFDFDETCLGRALELLARLAVRMAGGGQEDTETETESDMEFLDEVVRRKGIHVQLWLDGKEKTMEECLELFRNMKEFSPETPDSRDDILSSKPKPE